MSERTFIPLSEPALLGNERRYLDECVATNFVSSVGPFVERFEREFAERVGSKYAVACASGTAALHVAMRLLDVGPGDEVAVSTLTFVASANAIVYERGTPLLVDAERETWNLDSDRLVEEIERRARLGQKLPKVIEAVHVLGHPARLESLVDACERHGIVLVEDASEALGARWTAGRFAGRHVGTVWRNGCLSVKGNKIITTGGGGMIVTDDEKLARRAKHLTTQARLSGPEYRHDEVGYNYRLPNLAAALGVAQLEQLDTFVERKRAIAGRYDEALTAVAAIERPPRAAWAAPTMWLYSVLVDAAWHGGRDGLCQRMSAERVQARPIWTPLHLLPMFAQAPRIGGDVAASLFERGLSLPSSVTLTADDQARVIDVLLRAERAR